MFEKSADGIVEAWQPAKKNEIQRLTRNISIPVTEEYKNLYETIQHMDPGFIDVVRQVLTTTLDKARAKLST